MATKNIVPNANGEGSIGTATKGWGAAFITNASAPSNTAGGKLTLISNDGTNALDDNDQLGIIEFKGAESSSAVTIGASIEAICDANWSASENGASLVFKTTDGDNTQSVVLTLDSNKNATFANDILLPQDGVVAFNSTSDEYIQGDSSILYFGVDNAYVIKIDGGNDRVEVASGHDLRLDNGNLVINTAGKGIDFSAESPSGSGSSSALLDDYEEGSWTPALTVTSGSLTVTLDSGTNAKYVKIGKQVTCWFYILTDVFTPDTASALVQIDGQPFASEDFHVGGSVYYVANGFAGDFPSSISYATSTRVYLIYRDTADDYSREIRADDFTSGSNNDQHQFWGVFHYTAAT